MASRRVHNLIARKLTGLPSHLIDEVNRDTDSPVKTMGSSHRKVRHSANPLRMDSLVVTGGDPRKEVVRQIHRVVDTTPIGKAVGNILELQNNIRRLRK